MALTVGDVRDGYLYVIGKGGHERTVPYGRSLDAALRRYLSRARPLVADPDAQGEPESARQRFPGEVSPS